MKTEKNISIQELKEKMNELECRLDEIDFKPSHLISEKLTDNDRYEIAIKTQLEKVKDAVSDMTWIIENGDDNIN